jgi:hypothetical protein
MRYASAMKKFDFSLLCALLIGFSVTATLSHASENLMSENDLAEQQPSDQPGTFAGEAASDDDQTPVANPQCRKDNEDPYEPSVIMTFGKFKGQCVDASTTRPPVLLSQNDSVLKIANFYHNGRYWIATIPKNGVSSVQFQGIPFQKIAFGLIIIAHGQLRFKLNQPITLESQSHDLVTDSVSDIIISSVATHPIDIKYSILHGSSFGIITRVLSTTGRAVEEISEDKSPVHQYQLTMTPDQMNRLLQVSMTKASDDGYKTRYGLLKDNCVTKTFDAWDEAFARPAGVKRLQGHWWLIHDEIEHPGLVALRERNVPYEKVKNLNTEVQCAKPGHKLGSMLVTQLMVGAASALCKFNGDIH